MERHHDRRTSGRAQNAPIGDPYQTGRKVKEPSVCRECGSVFTAGRWRWPDAADGPLPAGTVHRLTCPACRRIRSKLPAGIVTIVCEASRLEEAEGIARNCELAEAKEHALARIMGLVQENGGLRIETTDIHLPAKIGKSLERGLGGELKIEYEEDGYFVRVQWQGPRGR